MASFEYGDIVRVVRGFHKGRTGTVIAECWPEYMVQFEDSMFHHVSRWNLLLIRRNIEICPFCKAKWYHEKEGK